MNRASTKNAHNSKLPHTEKELILTGAGSLMQA